MSRYQLSQFRAGTRLLHIKSGRWVNTPLEESPCRLCIDQCTEEFHFLCVCRLYQNEGAFLYDRVSELHPEFASVNAQEKFVYLLRLHMKIGK